LYLLHLLASPLLYLGRGLLWVVLLPLHFLAKFEVISVSLISSYLMILEAHAITDYHLFHDWSGAHRSHCRPNPLLYG
jgi:hypothetical protein